MPREVPDLSALEGVVSSKVLNAMRTAHEELNRLGVRHLLVGGLAVGAYGYPLATKGVDFLVGDEVFIHHGSGIVTMKPGVPIEVSGVVVDHLSAQTDEEHLRTLLKQPRPGNPAVVPIEVLIYLKLKSPRARDRADAVEPVKAGIDVQTCREYLHKNAPDLLLSLEATVQSAVREEE